MLIMPVYTDWMTFEMMDFADFIFFYYALAGYLIFVRVRIWLGKTVKKDVVSLVYCILILSIFFAATSSYLSHFLQLDFKKFYIFTVLFFSFLLNETFIKD